jgi:hypothetical protein
MKGLKRSHGDPRWIRSTMYLLASTLAVLTVAEVWRSARSDGGVHDSTLMPEDTQVEFRRGGTAGHRCEG